VSLWYEFWKRFFYLIARLAFRLKIEGRDHEPGTGPLIVAGNHASLLDPPLVGMCLRRQGAYMAKDELFSVPLLGAWLRSIGSFPVRRGTADRQAIRRSLELLQRGGVLVIFPEGTRSTDGRLRDPEPGAAMLALRTGVRVLPAAVVNSHRILPKGARWPRFEQVTVRFGPVLDVPKIEGRLDHATMESWGRRIMAEIEQMLPADQRPAGTSTSSA
jgi:1-acyl-sn-glycerol-3-phosphate acyltransferase